MKTLFASLIAASGLLAGAAQSTPFDVRTFRPWAGYAIPNGEWRLLDFNGDGRDDVVHVVAGTDYVHSWRSNGDGTFAVGTFRPWAGYAMPNGQWLTGDLNADGRDDLVHLVQGADYVHAWMSRGDGSFAVGTFRPWTGYAIPNGEWRVIDFDGDGRSDLVHIVAGTDYVHTWRSNGDGTFRVGTFRPWNGYAMPNGIWLTGDYNADGRGDLVHAVQGADYVHPWLSNGNGTFSVGTFRPWAGYAIPNGEWRSLDFDGDRRTDIVHVVAGSDYVHTWRSNGNGTFAVGTFRPWAGYAMPNGLWLTGDLDADGRGDLVHAVANSTYVHTWLSRGDGSFRVGTFNPWPGYAVPNGLWLSGDLSGDGRSDILHAVQSSDYVHPWISAFPRAGEFAIEGLEITQAIQSMNHGVALVANKPTVVRVYPEFNGSGTHQVRGRLWVRNTSGAPWQLLSSANVATVAAAENGNLRLKREDATRSLNFVVPPGVLGTGQLVAWFQDMQDAGTGAGLPCADCFITHRTLGVGDANPMRLRVIGLRYARGTPAQTFQPGAADFNLLRSWLTRAYPTGDLRMTSTTLAATAAAPFGCGDANAQLTAIRNADIAAGTDRRTHYYGIVFEDGSANSFFMRGCAAGIPSSPSPGTVASGPTGPGTWGWDNDGSYGDWYGGHELGHTYGRFHIGSGCGDSSDDANYPYPAGQLSGADGAWVGFDTGDAGLGLAMRALPGTVWHEVMSYCANQWISDYTYTRIRDRLVAENALPAGPTPPTAGAAVAGVAPDAEGPPAVVEGDSPPPAGVGDDGTAVVMVAPAYAPPGPVEAAGSAPDGIPEPAQDAPPLVVTGLAAAPEGLGTEEYAEGAADAGPLPPHLAEEDAGAVPEAAPPADTGPEVERMLQQGDFLAVAASVNLTRGTADIVDARRVPQGLVAEGDPGDTLALRALDADGGEIARWNVPFLPNSEREAGEDLMGVLDAVVPFPEGVRTIEVLVGGEVADSLTAPEPGPTPDVALEVVGGEAGLTVDGGLVALDWSAMGAVPDGTTFDIQASADGGQTWSTVAIGLTDTEADVDLSTYEGPVEVRLLMKDGFEERVLDSVRLGER